MRYLRQTSIADYCGVTKPAVANWRARGFLPNPDLVIDGIEFWALATVKRVAKEREAAQHYWNRPKGHTARPDNSARDANIRARFQSGEDRVELARQFGLSRERIYQIGHGRYEPLPAIRVGGQQR